jgi:hypothetical protein
MKTLILTEETWATMVLALDATPAGRDLLDRLGGSGPELPSDRELVRMARNGDDAPDAVALARAQRDAGIQAAADTRDAMREMIRHCYDAGVRPAVLMRWFGLKSSRLHEILKTEAERF